MASQESLAIRKLLKDAVASRAGKQRSITEMRQDLELMAHGTVHDQDIQVQKVTVAGIPGEWVVAPNAVENRVFLYLHGGGYCFGSCNTARELASRLSRVTATRVLVIEYRLAPEHPFPAAIEDSVSAYQWLISSEFSPGQIIIGGDSAGGGLALATLLTLRDAGHPLPVATVLLSPWTDMEGTGDSMETQMEFDPWLKPEEMRSMSALYIRDLEPRHPLVSPIYANLQGLPPMLVHVGRDEILLSDSSRLVERAHEAGVDVTFKIWEDMWHVFHSFASNVPEARKAIEEIGEYVVEKLRS